MATIDQWLGALESEELMRVQGELEELAKHPGWQTLERLLQIRAMSAQSRFAGKVMEQAEYAREGGIIHGLMQPAAIVKHVSAKAREVEAALTREAAAERRRQEENRDV